MPAQVLPGNLSLLELREAIAGCYAMIDLDERARDLALPYLAFLETWRGIFGMRSMPGLLLRGGCKSYE